MSGLATLPTAQRWMLGVITLEKSQVTEDQLMEAALAAGAEDYRDEGDVWALYTPPHDVDKVFKKCF